MATEATEARISTTGPAHVAVVSFLAARAVPSGGFWVALAGGVALARVAERRGSRQGFGASIAAMLETVAIIGPARFGVPLTQAITAPILGRLDTHGWPPLPQIGLCALLRGLHNGLTTAFFIWVIAGGLDAYAGTYDSVAGLVGLELGTTEALLITLVGLVAWALFASTVQVFVYRRGLRRWETEDGDAIYVDPLTGEKRRSDGAVELPDGTVEPSGGTLPSDGTMEPHRGRYDPRLVTFVAVVLFGVLLASTAWVVLTAVAGFLAVAWLTARPDNTPVPTGLVLAAALALGALLFSLGGGLGIEVALQRALRAALLVMVATWMRAAAGAAGLREVFQGVLRRLRRVPSVPEATVVLDTIETEGRLAAAGRSLADRLDGVSLKPLPVCDAVLDWAIAESTRGSVARAEASAGPVGRERGAG